jgi:hypothetical protein
MHSKYKKEDLSLLNHTTWPKAHSTIQSISEKIAALLFLNHTVRP